MIYLHIHLYVYCLTYHFTHIIGITEFVVLEKNELCDEQNIIDNENECQLAVSSTGKDDDGTIVTEIQTMYPRGCYAHDKDVFFNKYPVGKNHANSAPICRKGNFTYLKMDFKL